MCGGMKLKPNAKKKVSRFGCHRSPNHVRHSDAKPLSADMGSLFVATSLNSKILSLKKIRAHSLSAKNSRRKFAVDRARPRHPPWHLKHLHRRAKPFELLR